MTTQITKTWFVDGKIIEQVIPESEVYKRDWVGLTDEEIDSALGVYDSFGGRLDARKIEAKLKELNA